MNDVVPTLDLSFWSFDVCSLYYILYWTWDAQIKYCCVLEL